MDAFQTPASQAATSLLVPKAQYLRASGLQAFSAAAMSILAPALGSALYAFSGMAVVLTIDLASFAFAFLTLLLCVKVPAIRNSWSEHEPLWERCVSGVEYLRGNPPLMRLILFFSVINLLAKIGNDGMTAAFVLARTNADQRALGMVQMATSFGVLAGSALVTVLRSPRRRMRLIFCTCGLTFLGNVVQSLTRTPLAWALTALAAYISAAVMNAHLTTVMRSIVPVEIQGRVFSAKDTLQNCTIPLGLFLGSALADRVFEPFMAIESPGQRMLSAVFGSGSGSGIAIMFFFVGIVGAVMSFSRMNRRIYRKLDDKN